MLNLLQPIKKEKISGRGFCQNLSSSFFFLIIPHQFMRKQNAIEDCKGGKKILVKLSSVGSSAFLVPASFWGVLLYNLSSGLCSCSFPGSPCFLKTSGGWCPLGLVGEKAGKPTVVAATANGKESQQIQVLPHPFSTRDKTETKEEAVDRQCQLLRLVESKRASQWGLVEGRLRWGSAPILLWDWPPLLKTPLRHNHTIYLKQYDITLICPSFPQRLLGTMVC